MKYNLTTFRKLIIEAFSDEELQIFVHDYFADVSQSFSMGMSIQMKAQQLVTYCQRREQLAALEEKLKSERREKYEKYKDQLQIEDGKESESILDEMRAKESELDDVLEAVNLEEPPQQPVAEADSSARETSHPLTGESPTIRKWFTEELDFEEQTFVMTAALFSGLERQELLAIHQDILNILQPAKPETKTEVDHD